MLHRYYVAKAQQYEMFLIQINRIWSHDAFLDNAVVPYSIGCVQHDACTQNER